MNKVGELETGRIGRWAAWTVVVAMIAGYTWAFVRFFGGWAGLTSDWPLLQADHALHYTHAVNARGLVANTGFLAGYDPSFMAGYPQSVISGTSSNWANLAVGLFGGQRPAVAIKVAVLVAGVLVPILLAVAGVGFGLRAWGVAWAVGLLLGSVDIQARRTMIEANCQIAR